MLLEDIVPMMVVGQFEVLSVAGLGTAMVRDDVPSFP